MKILYTRGSLNSQNYITYHRSDLLNISPLLAYSVTRYSILFVSMTLQGENSSKQLSFAILFDMAGVHSKAVNKAK